MTIIYAAIFGFFRARGNPLKPRASPIGEPFERIKCRSRFDRSRFDFSQFQSGDTSNDPDRRSHFSDHVGDCRPADFDHAAAAQSGGCGVPDSQRPDRSRAAQVASSVASKRAWRLTRNRPNVVYGAHLLSPSRISAVMAKAVAKPKKIAEKTAAKSKPSVPVRAKAAPPAAARKALKKSPARPASKPAGKAAVSKPAVEAVKSGKWVFTFGDGKAEGKAGLRDLLGGKGANLAEMANLGLPVPPGFTIPTSVCTYFYAHDKSYPKELKAQVEKALDHVGKLTGKAFGDAKNPLLVSVRSGGRASIPGMMDTVLNLGLNDKTVEALIASSSQKDIARFSYDSYRRFITMYSDVVLGIHANQFESALEDMKHERGVELDTELSAEDLKELVKSF